MSITCAYRTKNDEVFLSKEYVSDQELASLSALNMRLSVNPELMIRPFLCSVGLVSSMHHGTIQYSGMITKHTKPLWLASKDFRGTIDFYYSHYEWPYQIRFQPQGFLNDFVIERLKNGFIVPIFTRQIRKDQTSLFEAHDKFACESREQIREKSGAILDLAAK